MQNNETVKQILFWVAIIIGIGLVVAGMIYLVSLQQRRPTTIPTASSVTIENKINTDDWVKGNRDSKVVLIEYSDFQCPACAYFYPVVNKLADEFGDRIAIVYRHFPLPNHLNAMPMVHVAEAAGRQGKFWEMLGLIFDGQKSWTGLRDVGNIARGYAETLGLDVDRYQKDLDSSELKQKNEAEVQKNRKLGITYTPSFFLNGKLMPNPKSYEEFRNVITQALDENR